MDCMLQPLSTTPSGRKVNPRSRSAPAPSAWNPGSSPDRLACSASILFGCFIMLLSRPSVSLTQQLRRLCPGPSARSRTPGGASPPGQFNPASRRAQTRVDRSPSGAYPQAPSLFAAPPPNLPVITSCQQDTLTRRLSQAEYCTTLHSPANCLPFRPIGNRAASHASENSEKASTIRTGPHYLYIYPPERDDRTVVLR